MTVTKTGLTKARRDRQRNSRGTSISSVVATAVSAPPGYDLGKTLELEHPQYFVDGWDSLQAKKGRKNFWGCCCGKWGIVLFWGKTCGALCAKNNTASSLFLPR